MISLLSPEAAASLIRDSDFVIVGGNGGSGAPEAVLDALGRRFDTDGAPRDLTVMHMTGIGAVDRLGLCHLAKEGLVGCVIGGHFGLQLPFMRLIREGLVEAYNLPQGVLTQLCRTLAAKQPGVLTHVGLGTYMDPMQEGGRMNARSTRSLVERVHLQGKDWLFYSLPGVPTVAIIRGTSADEDGYVSMEHEATTREDLSIAQAVHNAGGTVICQVQRVVRRGTLHPHMVKIPGFLVDHIVLVPEQMQTYGTAFDPSRCGETRMAISRMPPNPMSVRRVIARRAAMELRPGDVVNLGVGISTMIPNVAVEEGIEDLITLTVEAGVVGGVPGHEREFGTAYNPRAILDQAYQFDFYDGGGLTCAFVSFAEIDGAGNVNATRFGGRYFGSGGFINITQNAQRLVFSGTLTGSEQDIRIEDGRLMIARDGGLRKLVPDVGHLSFSAEVARARQQPVLYVTERAVFQLAQDGPVLVEIAPGVRLREDVLDRCGFSPRVSDQLRLMDERIFRPGPMAIRDTFLAQDSRDRMEYGR